MSIFSTIKVPKPKRSTFDLSHNVKLTTDFGRLTPILCQEVLPGDTFRVNSNVFCRVAPMVAPVLAQMDIYVHYFFVPNRLLWSKWEEFITGGEDGTSTPAMPTLTYEDLIQNEGGGSLVGSLADYLGLPTEDHKNQAVRYAENAFSALPFKAYTLIWNEWYRDQNLQKPIDIFPDASGPQGSTEFCDLRYRSYLKDYFTSALPWPQRGPEAVIPFAQEDPDVHYLSKSRSLVFNAATNTAFPADAQGSFHVGSGGALVHRDGNGNDVFARLETDGQVNLNGISPTVNELRRSISVQRWLEANARGGARYIEQILSHFGVKSSDARLQRPEFLGGGKSPIMVSEVLQNSETTDSSPLGTMAGHGVSANRTHSFKRFFEEHGFVIGILSVMPKPDYASAMSRMWLRQDKFDYAWPELANIGEQPIFAAEVNPLGVTDATEMRETFGYTPRYAEYKSAFNRTCGDFRTTLNQWTLSRNFGTTEPKLNSNFIQVGGPPRTVQNTAPYLSNIFAVAEGDHFWLQIFHNIKAKRPLPYYGIPAI